MRVLAFDTATGACSAAVMAEGTLEARRFEVMDRGHAERLMGMIADVMADAGRGWDDIDLIAVTNGPGAFTGLRIGLAAARGLALAAGLPVLAVTTTAAVARAAAGEGAGAILLAAVESRRENVFVQVFSPDLTPLTAPEALAPGALAGELADALGPGPVLVAGDGRARAARALAAAGLQVKTAVGPGLPDAADVAAIAAGRWAAGERPGLPPGPLYLSPPEAKVPKAGGRLRP